MLEVSLTELIPSSTENHFLTLQTYFELDILKSNCIYREKSNPLCIDDTPSYCMS